MVPPMRRSRFSRAQTSRPSNRRSQTRRTHRARRQRARCSNRFIDLWPTGRPGLGLGLDIASEIARAHGGEPTVTSVPEAMRFVLKCRCADRRLSVGAHDEPHPVPKRCLKPGQEHRGPRPRRVPRASCFPSVLAPPVFLERLLREAGAFSVRAGGLHLCGEASAFVRKRRRAGRGRNARLTRRCVAGPGSNRSFSTRTNSAPDENSPPRR